MLQSSVRRGELDREGTFLKSVKETGESNEDRITGWIEVDTDPTVFLRKRDLSGKDEVIAERLTYMQKTVFTGDWRTDITTENRLYVEGKVYEIIAVTDNMQSRGMYKDFMCHLLDTEEWTT